MQKILLVEDDLRLLDSIESFLSSELRNSEIFTCSDGKDGWEKYNKIHPNLVIVDNVMPVWNGAKLAKKIREFNPIVPIILITGYEVPQEKTIFSQIIQKPFRLEELLEVTRNHLLRLV